MRPIIALLAAASPSAAWTVAHSHVRLRRSLGRRAAPPPTMSAKVVALTREDGKNAKLAKLVKNQRGDDEAATRHDGQASKSNSGVSVTCARGTGDHERKGDVPVHNSAKMRAHRALASVLAAKRAVAGIASKVKSKEEEGEEKGEARSWTRHSQNHQKKNRKK